MTGSNTPRTGLFETILSVEGCLIDEDMHFERLTASASTILGIDVDADAVRTAIARRVRNGPGSEVAAEITRVRIDIGGDSETNEPQLDVSVTAALHPRDARDVTVITVDDWRHQAAHKTTDVSASENARSLARDRGSEDALFVRDGKILESSYANVIALFHGDGATAELRTPPLDGSILPGVTRCRVLQLARNAGYVVREVEMTVDDLRNAGAVYLTSAIRGVVAVSAIDGRQLTPNQDAGPGDRPDPRELYLDWLTSVCDEGRSDSSLNG